MRGEGILVLLGLADAQISMVVDRSTITGKPVVPIQVSSEKTVWAIADFSASDSEFVLDPRDCPPFVAWMHQASIATFLKSEPFVFSLAPGFPLIFQELRKAGGPDTGGVLALGPHSTLAIGNRLKLEKDASGKIILNIDPCESVGRGMAGKKWGFPADLRGEIFDTYIELGFESGNEIIIPGVQFARHMKGLYLPPIDKEQGLRFYYDCEKRIESNPLIHFEVIFGRHFVPIRINWFPQAGGPIKHPLEGGFMRYKKLCPTNLRIGQSSRYAAVGIDLILERFNVILDSNSGVKLEPHGSRPSNMELAAIHRPIFPVIPLFELARLDSGGAEQVWLRSSRENGKNNIYRLEMFENLPNEKQIVFSQVSGTKETKPQVKKLSGWFDAPAISVEEGGVSITARKSRNGAFAGTTEWTKDKIITSYTRERNMIIQRV